MSVTENQVYDNRGPGCGATSSATVGPSIAIPSPATPTRRKVGTGVFYEISYRCSIHDNIVSGNGPRRGAESFYHGGQIVISASSDCDVHDDVVIGNGVGALQQDRRGQPGPGRFATCRCATT